MAWDFCSSIVAFWPWSHCMKKKWDMLQRSYCASHFYLLSFKQITSLKVQKGTEGRKAVRTKPMAYVTVYKLCLLPWDRTLFLWKKSPYLRSQVCLAVLECICLEPRIFKKSFYFCKFIEDIFLPNYTFQIKLPGKSERLLKYWLK